MKTVAALALCLSLVGTVRATELVTQKEISVSRALAGHVLVWETEPVSGVTVELCAADWKTVFRSTKTDERDTSNWNNQEWESCFISEYPHPAWIFTSSECRIRKQTATELIIRLSVAA